MRSPPRAALLLDSPLLEIGGTNQCRHSAKGRNLICFPVSHVYIFVGGSNVHSQTGCHGGHGRISPRIRHCLGLPYNVYINFADLLRSVLFKTVVYIMSIFHCITRQYIIIQLYYRKSCATSISPYNTLQSCRRYYCMSTMPMPIVM